MCLFGSPICLLLLKELLQNYGMSNKERKLRLLGLQSPHINIPPYLIIVQTKHIFLTFMSLFEKTMAKKKKKI